MTPLFTAEDITAPPAEIRQAPRTTNVTRSGPTQLVDRVDSPAATIGSVRIFSETPHLTGPTSASETIPSADRLANQPASLLPSIAAIRPESSPISISPAAALPSEPYRRYKMSQSLRRGRSSLMRFDSSLGEPESAVWIREFRDVVGELRAYLGAQAQSSALDAIEATLRQRRWREFSRGHVHALAEAFAQLETVREGRDVTKLHQRLYARGLDVFPSVEEDYDDEID